MDKNRTYLIRGKIVEMKRATAPSLDGYIGIAIPDDELENLSMGEIFIMTTFTTAAKEHNIPHEHQKETKKPIALERKPRADNTDKQASSPRATEPESFEDLLHETPYSQHKRRMNIKQMTVIKKHGQANIYKEILDEIVDSLLQGPLDIGILYPHMKRVFGISQSAIGNHMKELSDKNTIRKTNRRTYELSREKPTDMGNDKVEKDTPLVDNRIRTEDPDETLDRIVLGHIKRGEWTAIDALLAAINKDRPKNPLGKEELEKSIFRLKDKGLITIEMLPSDTDPSKKILCCRRN